jgi:hypothetical protein
VDGTCSNGTSRTGNVERRIGLVDHSNCSHPVEVSSVYKAGSHHYQTTSTVRAPMRHGVRAGKRADGAENGRETTGQQRSLTVNNGHSKTHSDQGGNALTRSGARIPSRAAAARSACPRSHSCVRFALVVSLGGVREPWRRRAIAGSRQGSSCFSARGVGTWLDCSTSRVRRSPAPRRGPFGAH